MRLAKLTLAGFKSFADPTEFTFTKPITGVVGPNGCGKSNVVDAIKWVLGERSSKSLRGHEMIDVIFAGSAGRKPLGMASVKLTFENPVLADRPEPQAAPAPTPTEVAPAEAEGDAPQEQAGLVDASVRARRVLPIDEDVVEIERRLYRDGGSEYLINGRTARLKDIRELFLDTGVGADAYSIIEQGKVDAMLMASPQERRIIFEEAAGIAKYKQRRIEAQRKLDRAEANLKATKDELESTERRLRLVKGQAAKARKFVELDADLKAWRQALVLDQFDELQSRIDGLTSQQEKLRAQRDEAHDALLAGEQEKQESELALHDARQVLSGLERDALAAAHEGQQAQQRRHMLERLAEQTRREGESDRQLKAELQQRAGATHTAISDCREETAALGEKLAEAERRLSAAAQARAAALEELGDLSRAHAEKQGAAARIDRERVSLLASLEADAKRLEQLREQGERIAGVLARIARDQAEADSASTTARAALEASRTRGDELSAQLRQAEGQLATLGADRAQRAAVAAQLDQDAVRVESRLQTLEEMAQQRVGFAEAVRSAMRLRELARARVGSAPADASAQPDAFAAIVAPLADLVQVRPEVDALVASAVELALGDELQALVVPHVGAVPDAAALSAVGGRLSFLPLDVGPEVQPPAQAWEATDTTDPAGRVVALRALVQARAGVAPDGLDGLLDRLLRNAYLVTDLQAASLLSAGPLRGARFVTRTGEVLDARGVVTAGPAGKAAEGKGAEKAGEPAPGLLRRQAELESLRAQAAQLRERLAAERATLATVDAEAEALHARAGTLRAELAQAQRAATQQQNALERCTHDISRLSREAATATHDGEQMASRIAAIEADAATLREKAASLGRLADEELASAQALGEQLSALRVRSDGAGEQLTAAKVEVGTLSEQLGAARRTLAREEAASEDIQRRLRDVDARLEGQEGRLTEHLAAIASTIELLAQAQARASALAEQQARASAAVEDLASRCAALGERVVEQRRIASALERDFHSLEVSRRELEVKRESMHERTSQELGLDLIALHAEYRELVGDGSIARVEHAPAQRTIDELRDAIKRLGSVNMEALDEERTLEGLNERLVQQVADIESARAQLVALIEQLNTVSKDRFAGIFSRIQQEFGGEQGMFRRLFGGGRAEVRLMPLIKEVEQPDGSVAKVETDEIDVLESGVEVIAKPPGKEPRAISQLSGGEKTLTAVALLLSIFRSKPSCFCVLDEVDAALDEGNVGRFNNAIRGFTDQSSFIVITHNKRTMQNADHLYGVTMQERGVSTRVSVHFEQVHKDGSFSAPPAGAAAPAPMPAPEASESRPAPVEVEPPLSPAPAGAPAQRSRRERKPAVAPAPAQEQTPAVGVVAPAETPVVEIAQPAASLDAPAPSQSPEPEPAPLIEVPAPAPVVVSAPLGLGDSAEQTTTLGMSPLKRALAKLRSLDGPAGK